MLGIVHGPWLPNEKMILHGRNGCPGAPHRCLKMTIGIPALPTVCAAGLDLFRRLSWNDLIGDVLTTTTTCQCLLEVLSTPSCAHSPCHGSILAQQMNWLCCFSCSGKCLLLAIRRLDNSEHYDPCDDPWRARTATSGTSPARPSTVARSFNLYCTGSGAVTCPEV